MATNLRDSGSYRVLARPGRPDQAAIHFPKDDDALARIYRGDDVPLSEDDFETVLVGEIVEGRLPKRAVADWLACGQIVEANGPGDPYAINATPGAIELADELGIALSSVEGTGKGGKIGVSDVRKAAE